MLYNNLQIIEVYAHFIWLVSEPCYLMFVIGYDFLIVKQRQLEELHEDEVMIMTLDNKV